MGRGGERWGRLSGSALELAIEFTGEKPDGFGGPLARNSKTMTRLVTRNINTGTARTSMRLEPEFWEALRALCKREGLTYGDLANRAITDSPDKSRSSAVRCYLIRYFQEAGTDEGHVDAGHGLMPRQD